MSENSHFGNQQPFSPKKRAKSFVYAFKGIFYMIKTQHNFWIQMSLGILAVILGFILKISHFEWGLVILSIGVVLAAETFNSAVEALTDIV
ncbi:MAG: diacylglycerol kinase family protein, partial [Bacteroidales bacterium]|nr:diacylglycerol kinase family protein [Bacteroidales bacterium]